MQDKFDSLYPGLKKIIAYTSKDQHHWPYMTAFIKGLKKHGLKVDVIEDNKFIESDLLIMWGHRKNAHIRQQLKNNRNYLVLERGYIGDRHEFTSCGFNGLNGRANFVNSHIKDNNRSKQFIELLKPYRETKGSYIVIMCQIAGDASVASIGFNKWLDNTIKKLKTITDLPIYIRPHPLDKRPYLPVATPVIKGDLHDIIQHAHCVVTLNSNSGVDSVLAGIPTITSDRGAMAYNVTDHDLNCVVKPKLYARSDWFNKMAYTQWTIEEMQNGETWEHLRGFYG